jgi:hypothetical protein
MARVLYDQYPPVTRQDLAALEQRARVVLPEAQREFLLRSNGGRVEPGEFDVPGWPGRKSYIDTFFGLHPGEGSIAWWLEELGDRLPYGFVPIGVDPGGNFVVLDAQPASSGEIFYWDSSDDWDIPEGDPTMYVVAPTRMLFSHVSGMSGRIELRRAHAPCRRWV